MSESKRKKLSAFSPELIKQWEEDKCVNFAIALARKTGWLLQVAWRDDGPTETKGTPEELMVPLRAYVADSFDNVFDVRGIKKWRVFSEGTLRPLVEQEAPAGHVCGVRDKFYSEQKLGSLPIKHLIDEKKVSEAEKEISRNAGYLSQIPERKWPYIPAHDAGDFTFGLCAAYAEALHEATGLPIFAMIVTQFKPQFGHKLGYVHSFVMHPDGEIEDVWGKCSVRDVADRFYALGYDLSEELHKKVVENLKTNTPEPYAAAFQRAKALIEQYRN